MRKVHAVEVAGLILLLLIFLSSVTAIVVAVLE